MNEPIQREYRYRVSLYLLWAFPLFSALMSGCAIYFALTNSEPVYLQGILEFPAPLANIGAWAAGIVFALLFAGSLVFVLQAVLRRQRLALTPTALLVPRGFWSAAEDAIPYRDILELVLRHEPDKSRTLFVVHRQGKYPLSESLLPSKAAFEELWEWLASRTAANKPE